MSVRLKKLKDQVIVITGASSGIGLATAKMAAARGARVVLSSRNIDDLEKIRNEINVQGGHAVCVEADVADPKDVDRIAERAIESFGGFDTWVNNAGIGIYSKVIETDDEEARRVLDVNFWGMVNGCRTAVPYLRSHGGALINIGSVVSERGIPLQGFYSASKHAMKAYTDALRMELEAEGAPISITLIKPASIDTPFTDHAMNHLAHHPSLPAPVYTPEIVAEAILECAEHPKRDVMVGGSAKLMTLMETFLPRLADYFMEKNFFEQQQTDALAAHDMKTALFKPAENEGDVRGRYEGHVSETSAYTKASLHPGAAALIAAGLGVATVFALRSSAANRH